LLVIVPFVALVMLAVLVMVEFPVRVVDEVIDVVPELAALPPVSEKRPE
jgi:hypothetical protein